MVFKEFPELQARAERGEQLTEEEQAKLEKYQQDERECAEQLRQAAEECPRLKEDMAAAAEATEICGRFSLEKQRRMFNGWRTSDIVRAFGWILRRPSPQPVQLPRRAVGGPRRPRAVAVRRRRQTRRTRAGPGPDSELSDSDGVAGPGPASRRSLSVTEGRSGWLSAGVRLSASSVIGEGL